MRCEGCRAAASEMSSLEPVKGPSPRRPLPIAALFSGAELLRCECSLTIRARDARCRRAGSWHQAPPLKSRPRKCDTISSAYSHAWHNPAVSVLCCAHLNPVGAEHLRAIAQIWMRRQAACFAIAVMNRFPDASMISTDTETEDECMASPPAIAQEAQSRWRHRAASTRQRCSATHARRRPPHPPPRHHQTAPPS